MEFDIISVAIDKKKLLDSRFKNYDVLQTAYIFLVERFDKFLRKKSNKGMIRIDATSNKPNSPNAKDRKILRIINEIRMRGTNWQPIKNIIEEHPYFIIPLRARVCR